MRIKSVRIKNFRCIRDVQVDFDSVTTFIGPNGSGKSTILRALDWFFNGIPVQLTNDDVYAGADAVDRSIEVEVTFSDLSVADRNALTEKYAPAQANYFSAQRSWSLTQGLKTTGKSRAYPAFEEIRAQSSAKEKSGRYNLLLQKQPELGLPKWTKVEDAESVMKAWEQNNPELLSDAVVDCTHFFGFNGNNVLSGLFDYVFVPADLRAAEESLEGKNTVVGRILSGAIDRTEAAAEIAALASEVEAKQAQITAARLAPQLESLQKELTNEVTEFAAGRKVQLKAATQPVRPPLTTISVSIADDSVATPVERQGHGFQRALLIASLKLLAKHNAQSSGASTTLLAIEEPELFQHPAQARVFARVLRELAKPGGSMQVAYATHSPYFVDARYFDQIRRVTRRKVGQGHHDVSIARASIEAVAQRLDGTSVTGAAIRSRWEQVCTTELAEALFADAVVLVEGDTDKAIIDGISARGGARQLEADGVTVAYSHGKRNLLTPHAILFELKIPCLVVFDGDSGCKARLLAQGKKDDADVAEADAKKLNRELLKYLGLPQEDFPEGARGTTAYVWRDRIEDAVGVEWPEWDACRSEIVNAGRGVLKKNAATFFLASRECTTAPAAKLLQVVELARSLVLGNS